MIEISSSTAAVLYLGATLFAILGIWIYNHYIVKKRKPTPLSQALNVCEFCHFAYLESSGKNVTRCPRCNSYNNSTKEK